MGYTDLRYAAKDSATATQWFFHLALFLIVASLLCWVIALWLLWRVSVWSWYYVRNEYPPDSKWSVGEVWHRLREAW